MENINFVAIDFETANYKRSSACSIGLAFVENGKVTGTYHKLIQPTPNYYEPQFTGIHGIDQSQTETQPTFAQLWHAELKEKLSGKVLVAHNAAFDMSVLRALADHYNIELSDVRYLCTYRLSKLTYPQALNFQLPTIARHIGYQFSKHHNAEADAQACANVMLDIVKAHNASNLEELKDVSFGRINSQEEHTPFHCNLRNGTYTPRPSILTFGDVDTENPFYQKTIVFTGSVPGYTRAQANAAVIESGGYTANSVSSKVDILVSETLDEQTFKTSKFIKALLLKSKGHTIELIDANSFLDLLSPRKKSINITYEMIAEHSKYFLSLDKYNAFYSRRVLFSSDISTPENWQRIANCGGACCWLDEDMKEADFFVISNASLEKLQNNEKCDTILRYENMGNVNLEHDISKSLLISEKDFKKYITRRKAHESGKVKMKVLPTD